MTRLFKLRPLPDFDGRRTGAYPPDLGQCRWTFVRAPCVAMCPITRGGSGTHLSIRVTCRRPPIEIPGAGINVRHHPVSTRLEICLLRIAGRTKPVF